MRWVFKDGSPIYQQIVQILQSGIANGTYPPGSKMPAVRDLAMEAGVNPNTMQRALSELERDELLYSVRTTGRFVTEDGARLARLRSSLSESYIKDMFTNLYELGFTDEQILEEIEKMIAASGGKGKIHEQI